MLKKLRLHNFKTFLNTEIDFHRLHLLIGRNNSGKSNLCAALRFLRDVTVVDLDSAQRCVHGGVAELTNFALKDKKQFSIGCICVLDFEGKEVEFDYSLDLRVDSTPSFGTAKKEELAIVAERLSVTGAGFAEVSLLSNDGVEVAMLNEEAYVAGSDDHTLRVRAPAGATMLSKLMPSDWNRRAMLFRNYLAAITYYALSPLAIRDYWRAGRAGDTVLSHHGENLAPVLFHTKSYDGVRFRRIIDFVRSIAEQDLQDINFVPATDQVPPPFIATRLRQQASWSGLSDGTLRLLAIAWIVEHSSLVADGGVASPVLMEELENGIHPGLLRRVFDFIDDRAPRTQFIFTSHSPYFINLFDGRRDRVSLLTRDQERTLVAPPRSANVKDPDRELLAEEYVMELL